MKIVVPFVGPVPDQKTVGYVIRVAERLHAQLVVVRVLAEKEAEAVGEQSLGRFMEQAKEKKLQVNGILRRGEIAPAIIEVAEANAADLIILGVSHGEIVAEWMNAKAMEKTDIPVLLIPKWVPAANRPSPKG